MRFGDGRCLARDIDRESAAFADLARPFCAQSSPWWVGYIEKYPEQQGSFPSNYVKLAGGDGWKDTMMLDLPAGP